MPGPFNQQNLVQMGVPQPFNGTQVVPLPYYTSPPTTVGAQPSANWNRPVMASQYNNFGLPGRVIANANDIRPGDVPMDGSVSLFPTSDYTSIYAKAWGADGTIQTIRYIPEPSNQPEVIDVPVTSEPSELSKVMDRLDAIEQLLTNVSIAQQPTKKQNTKGKGDVNE